ncbi:MAG: hypothetical protein ABIE47_11750 [Pseudomonadota bacterium]|nr:hypothetical protein [Pseudomonadota bacterium]
MTSRKISLSSPIEEKIAWARYYYDAFGEALLEQERIGHLLESLKGDILASRREMALTGIVDICRHCDREEGGSCCGAGIENRYDGWLLLINLFLGVDLPKKRWQDTGCFLSGENGCLLMARHVICINYTCKKVTDRIAPCAIRELRENEGKEINTLFMLHESIKKALRQWTND